MIKVLGTKERKDGGLDVKIEYTKEFKKTIKEIYNKKRFSKVLVKKFVLEAIEYYVKK